MGYRSLTSALKLRSVGSSGYRALTQVNGAVIAPVFTTQPLSQSVDEYGTATFTVAATNYDSLQWYKKGIAVTGATGVSYSFATTATDNAATVYCVVSKGGLSVQSNTVTLTVLSYIYQLDGVTQSYSLTESLVVPAATKFCIEIEFRCNSSSNMLLSSTTPKPYIYVRSDGRAVFEPADGVFIPSLQVVTGRNVTLRITVEGTLATILEVGTANPSSKTFPMLGALDFTDIATRVNTLNLDGYVKKLSLSINGSTTNLINLNNKPQGSTQIATVGGINATIINYNASGWVQV